MNKLYVSNHLARRARGRHSARLEDPEFDVVTWAEREGDKLVIDRPGLWRLHATDGRYRVERAELLVREDGSYELVGDRFEVTVVG